MKVTRVFSDKDNFDTIYYAYLDSILEEIIQKQGLEKDNNSITIVPHKENECEVK
jgi:hypothetical protein